MGEMADYNIEQGEATLISHLTGNCGEYGICQYCEEEIEQKENDK